jgi:hypothetical protein
MGTVDGEGAGPVTVQSVSSIVRQVLAVLVTVYGVLTASVTALHLPVAVSSVLVAFGPLMLGLEHYLSDPSTGTPTPPAPVPTTVGNLGSPLP